MEAAAPTVRAASRAPGGPEQGGDPFTGRVGRQGDNSMRFVWIAGAAAAAGLAVSLAIAPEAWAARPPNPVLIAAAKKAASK